MLQVSTSLLPTVWPLLQAGSGPPLLGWTQRPPADPDPCLPARPQNVLKFTEQEHPDYYLLLVCVQRLRVFIAHYTLLFQGNEDLLIQKRKRLKK